MSPASWQRLPSNHVVGPENPGRYRWRATVLGPFSELRAKAAGRLWSAYLSSPLVNGKDVKVYVAKRQSSTDGSESTEVIVAWSVSRG